MGTNIYKAVLIAIARNLLLVVGGWLVSRGLLDDGLMQEAVTGLAAILVATVWEFVALHRQRLYERWLVALGLDSPADSDPATIDEAARDATRRGLQP